MTYQVLARKWRPHVFSQMIGQEHVLKALINALDQQRLHHAYLFTGTRGVGKTTIARILAKALNCEHGVSSNPCGECSACTEINDGRFIDLIEVDAASRTKVEDTRELLDNVQYTPTRGRFKVYLIDEVHMLSTHSFNALLKTLEEPPPHIKFLLATTDPQKLPATILSRCLQFNLKRMPIAQIIGHLDHILKQESIIAEDTAIKHLARAADGSMRDALSLLDQAIAYGQGKVESDDVQSMLGLISTDYVYEILSALAEKDASKLLACINKLDASAPDYQMVLDECITQLHQLSLAHMAADAIDDAVVDKDAVMQLAERISIEDVQLYYQIGLIGKRDIYLAPTMKSGFEMIALRMLAFSPLDASAGAKTTMKVQSTPVMNSVNPESAEPAAAISSPPNNSEAQIDSVTTNLNSSTNTEHQMEPGSPKLNGDGWKQIVSSLGLKGMVAELANNCALKEKQQEMVKLTLGQEHAQLYNKSFEERLKESLTNYYNEKIVLTIEIGSPEAETPAEQLARANEEKHQHAINEIENDEVVKAFKKQFDAEVKIESVKPL